MPTIIDSLIVELGLDPSKFTAGEKDAASAMVDLRRRTAGHGKDVEQSYKNIADGFERVGRKILGYYTLLLGGVTLTNFSSNLVEADRNLGILSSTTGESVKDLSMWQQAFSRHGGSAAGGGIVNVIGGINRERQSFATGTPLQELSYIKFLNHLSAVGVTISPWKKSGELKTGTEVLKEIIDTMPLWRASEANLNAFLSQLPGMDDTTLAVMKQASNGNLQRWLAEQEKIGVATQASADAAASLNSSYQKLMQTIDQLGRTSLTGLGGTFVKIIETTENYFATLNKILTDPKASIWWRGFLFIGQIGSLPMRIMGGILGVDEYAALAWKYITGGTGGPSGAAPRGAAGHPEEEQQGHLGSSPPSEVLEKAKSVALQGGPEAVRRFMAEQGYPMHAQWCGDFAAAVIRSAGGVPPKNASVASNWRNFGKETQTPQPGDIAVRRGARTGDTGSHVTIVESYDQKSGSFSGIGGNQGRFRSRFPTGNYQFFHSEPTPSKKASPVFKQPNGDVNQILKDGGHIDLGTGKTVPSEKPPTPSSLPSQLKDQYGALNGGKVVMNMRRENNTRTDIGAMTVNSQASDPAGIAQDILRHLRETAEPMAA